MLLTGHAPTWSDMHYFLARCAAWDGAGITHQLPQIMGLDGAGFVEEVDAGEILLSLGAAGRHPPEVTNGRREFCQRGEGVLCTTMRYLGEHWDGNFAQWISVLAEHAKEIEMFDLASYSPELIPDEILNADRISRQRSPARPRPEPMRISGTSPSATCAVCESPPPA